ncbi:MAG: hypothetical protein ACREQJ_05580, partial [Candidatus Binatia bacterium]
MRRGLAVSTIVLLALGLALFAARDRVARKLGRIVERALADSLPLPVEVASVDVELLPPRLTLRSPSIKREGRSVASAAALVLDVAVSASLWEGDWLVDAEIDRPVLEIDFRDPWWNELGGGNGSDGAGLKRLRVRDGAIAVRGFEGDASATFRDVELSIRSRGAFFASADVAARASATVARAG